MLERDAATISQFDSKRFTGRRMISAPVQEITPENVVAVLSATDGLHQRNREEIQYLYHVYCGWQDIQGKVKQARPETNNKVCVNRANEIVTFKTAYLLNEPLQYISQDGDNSESVHLLNEFMRSEDKESKDKEVADWMHICGIGIRLVLPDPESDKEGAPFYIATLDPRDSYVIYGGDIRKRPVAGVISIVDSENQPLKYVYTRNTRFVVQDNQVTKEDHYPDLGRPPIVEYAANMPRLGAFEVVLSILNAINELESASVDNVQDFVNAFDVFQNCELEDGKYRELGSGGKAISIKTVVQGQEAKVYRIASEINQSGVQTRIDDLTSAYLEICGMPSRSSGDVSTSDNVGAVIYRSGWSEAESRAKDTEKYFYRAERDFLRLVLRICESTTDLNLELKDIGINFGRKSLSNVQSSLQCLCEGLNNGMIHPKSLYDTFGKIFGDANQAYRLAMEWIERQENAQEAALREELDNARLLAKSNATDSGDIGGGEENGE